MKTDKTVLTIDRLSKKISELKKQKAFIIPEISEYIQGSAINKALTVIASGNFSLMKIQ